jgi:hypothetical protein
MPKGVIRFYTGATYLFGGEEYDKDGEAQDVGFDSSAVNVGGAIEYGVTDQITLALQWIPGYTVWSKLDPDPVAGAGGESDVNGPFDVFVGGKVQILGPKGFVPNDTMRAAAAPGVVVPLPGQKASDQDATKDDYTIAELEKHHALGVGARAYFDYIVNEMFFVNLFGEFIFFPEKEYDDSINYANSKVEHGYDLILELEPQATFDVAPDTSVEVALAGNFQASPAQKVDGIEDPDGSSYVLALRPNVSVFLAGAPVPLEFKLVYNLPLMGQNSPKLNWIQLQGRVYLEF